MTLNIITIESEANKGNSILKTRAQNVTFPLSKEDLGLINDMKAMVYGFEGVGLAAPQVGYAKRIAVIYIPESASLLRDGVSIKPLHAIINPEYEGIGDKMEDFEGCYSVDSLVGKVPRFYKIRVTYQNEDGDLIDEVVDGFYARVLQHEIDHLNGLLITDRLLPGCIQGSKGDMMKLRRKELPTEKRHHFDELLKKKGIVVEGDD